LIFIKGTDRLAFLTRLKRLLWELETRCHAFTLLGTHYHLLLETPDSSLATVVKRLNGPYAQTFNRKYGRVGHLFESRYKALAVESERHYFACVSYIAWNPVRAGLCKRPADWPWGSYAAAVGGRAKVSGPSFPHLALFGDPREKAVGRLRVLVENGKLRSS
jgi:putative transposase